MPRIKHCVKLFYSLASGAKAEPSAESGRFYKFERGADYFVMSAFDFLLK